MDLDILVKLDSQPDHSLSQQLQAIHQLLADKLPRLARIAVAIYHDGADTVHTLAHSSVGDNPLPHYAASLAAVPSLRAIKDSGQARVLNDLPAELMLDPAHPARHSQRLLEQGYRSSYTIPIYHHDEFIGFIFFNARETGFFDDDTLPILGFAAKVIATSVVQEVDATRILTGTLIALGEITRFRDPETGGHLKRMARFANLIASRIGDARKLPDEFAESVYRYAPLHDVGKLATPDAVLLKPGRLTDAEWAIMREHPQRGVNIVETILRSAATPLPQVELLTNIIHYHHEAWDGSGYPEGLVGERIPLEARIVTVADVFDALTTRRPYKEPWSNQATLAWMQERAGSLFDPTCIDVLAAEMDSFAAIQQQFPED
jgi:HD-GYP domain-containing protein (c-di-GMP phosphodiesterase class II)